MSALPRTTVSIIVPTHNRGPAIDLCLNSLAAQTYPGELIQTIVVADGCTDDTVATVMRRAEGSILLLEQANSGPAAARNAGAAAAMGELLIFLDDDMEAVPGFVAAHVAAHQKSRPPLVVVGYCPARLQGQKGLYRTALYDWWERAFDLMAAPNRRFRYTEMLSGNVSVPKALFEAVGGFNTELWCHEDYELGLKLVDHGAAFRFEPAALSMHNERSSFRKAFTRKYDEGVADVQIGTLHPHVVPSLTLARRSSFRKPNIPHLLGFAPWLVRAPWDALLGAGLRLADVAQFRRVWRRLTDHRLALYYWMGVAQKLGDRRGLRRFVDGAAADLPARPSLTIDVSGDLAALERKLDEVRPGELVIRYRDQHVGRAWSEPGFEWLHGAHLRPLLGYDFAYELIMAMGSAAVDGVAPPAAKAASPAPRRVGSDVVDV